MAARPSPFNLVNWPVNDDRYHHTGENGMYAYAVITATDAELPTACHVEALARLAPEDTCVSREGDHLWPARYDADESSEASAPLWTAIFLGSTDVSLAREDGEYFEVTCDDLTPAGGALFEELSLAYGGGITLLTFLDT